MKYSECLHCSEINEVSSASRDELGWHTSCAHCGGSYDIGIEDYLLPNGTKVVMPDGRLGIIDGSDEETSDELENINYYVCPIEFTAEKVWSNHYVVLRRDDLAIAEEWRLTRRYNDLVSRVCHYPKSLEHSNAGCYNCEDRTKCNANIFERLAQYEDSGFKPEDLREYRKLEDELMKATDTTLRELCEWIQSRKREKEARQVLIAKDASEILSNRTIRSKYPKMYEEVSRHQLSVGGDWCPLSMEAYSEWKRYRIDDEI